VWFGRAKDYEKTVFTDETLKEGSVIDAMIKIIKRKQVRLTNEIKVIMIPWFSKEVQLLTPMLEALKY
jgi:hypothetical protein